MSQNDFNIANQGFPQFRTDLNSALQSLASTSAGATAPGTTYAYQLWYDTSTNLLKMRNADNDGFITLAAFDQAAAEWELRTAVVQAVDSAGVVIKTDDGVARISVADNGNVTLANDLVVTGTVQSSNISATGSMASRNKIINGAMTIDQRNAGASYTQVNSAYSLDRWSGNSYDGGAVASKFSVQRSTTAPTGFFNSMLVTSLSASATTTSDIYNIEQKIEGFNTSDLMYGTANAVTTTLSFWVRSSLTGTFGGAIKNEARNRAYPFTYTINAANTFEYKTITIPGDTTGTWVGGTNGTGISLSFGLGVGSSFSGTAGAWGAGDLFSATGAQYLISTSGATFYITGVQLEAGDTATPFEHRSFGQELALCQRYYEFGETALLAVRIDTGSFYFQNYWRHPFKVTKRATPTLGITMTSGATLGCGANTENVQMTAYSYNDPSSATVLAANWTASAEL